MIAPLAPVVLSFTSKNITKSSTGIHLWPVEQRNGPISAYQVIVLKVADGAKELPDGYVSKLTDSNNASKDNLNFYVAAEIENVPVHEEPWEFTVGDEKTFGVYLNKGLKGREVYIIYQRAVTHVKDVILGGDASEVAKISIQEDKPVIKDLPERTIVAVGALAILSCQVIGDSDISVTWSKDGNTSIPRAHFDNDGHILVIKDVLPRDSGVYECKASNNFGESRTTTILIVAVSPSVIEDFSPPSVICEKQTPCSLSCHATSDTPFNYSWTKNGHFPVSDDVKVMNNRIVVTPRDAKDYGVYVCHATNNFGSTTYKITLSEGHKSSTPSDTLHGDDNAQHIFIASIIVLSCTVFVLLVVIGVLIWRQRPRQRRTVPDNRTSTAGKVFSEDAGQPDSPRDQHVSEPASYMELQPRLSQEQLPAAPQYQTLQGKNKAPGYYNVGFNTKNKEKEDAEIYDEIGNAHC